MKQICVKIEENLLDWLDEVIARKPHSLKRNTAIRMAIRDYVKKNSPRLE